MANGNGKWTIVVPKNRSLKACREKVERLVEDEGIKKYKVLEARGEDIAFFVHSIIKEGGKAIGITGEDLFKEWKLNNPSEHLDIIRRYEWKDEEAMFNKPVLCLLGPKKKELEDLPKKLRVAISDKYKRISKHYLNFLEDHGYSFKKFYLSGSVEEAFPHGIADVIIDIVYSGKSADECGLRCYRKIFECDMVAIGKKEFHHSLPKISIVK